MFAGCPFDCTFVCVFVLRAFSLFAFVDQLRWCFCLFVAIVVACLKSCLLFCFV